jgi:pentatricopeptide repeat protein
MILSNHSDYQPNSITCSSLIDLTLKNNDIDKAFEVVRYMRDRKLTLNEVTYTSLICELTRLGQVSYDDNNTYDDGDIVIMMTTTMMMMIMMG